MFAGTFKGYTSMGDMQNVHAELLNKEFKISAEGISEFTSAQIQAKAASMGLSESLSTELIALGKDATLAQKASTGKLTFGKALKENIGSIEELADALKNSGLIKGGNLDSLNGSIELGGDVLKNDVNRIINDVDGVSDAVIDLGSKAEKTGSSIGQVFTGMVASITPLLPAIVAVTVALGALAAMDYSEHEYTRAVEKFESSATEYAEARDRLSTLNSELETTTERIQELSDLQANGTITFADEVELEKLQKQNDELERNIELQKSLIAIKEQVLADSAKSASESEQSYMEHQEEESGGLWGKVKGFLGYFSSEGISAYDATEDNGVVMKKTEAQKWEEQDTTITGLVRAKIQELEKAKKELESVENELIDDPTNQKLLDKQNKLKEDVTSVTEYLGEKASTLQSWIDQCVDSNGEIISGAEEYVDAWNKALTEINNIGKTQGEIDLNNLETFFHSTSGSPIGNYLKDIVEESGSATDALDEFKRLGLSLDDIGVSEDGFIRYFEDVAKSAEEAQSAIGTFEDVQLAFESANQGANYDTLVSNMKAAEEAYENGLIGTDEFQSMAQLIAPYNIAKDLEKGLASGDYTYAAEAYKKAWEECYKKVNGWFDEDNPVKSMWNFVDALEAAEKETGKNLVDINKQTGEIIPKFETTAEAAEALGVNVELVDIILNKMKEYGSEFDGITFSGEGLNEYKSSLEGIRDIYDNMAEGASKTRLGNLLEGWDEDYARFQEDLSSLTQEQVVHISFEYDLASIQAEIDEIVANIEAGNNTVENNAAVIVGNEKYINVAEKGVGFETEGVEIPVQYTANEDAISALKEQLDGITDEEDKVAIQAEIRNLQEVQKELLNAFSDAHPEINADSSIEEINTAWESFVDGAEGREIIAKMRADNEEAKEKVAEILGIDPEDIIVKIEAEDNASLIIDEVNKKELLDKTGKLTGVDHATGLVNLWNLLEANPKFTSLSAEDQASSVITYWNSLNPIQKVAIMNSQMTATDEGATKIISGVDGLINSMNLTPNAEISATDLTAPAIFSANLALDKIDGKTVNTYIKTTEISAGDSNLNGTAHANGTAGLYPIPKLSTRALAMGTLEDRSWLKNSWKTENGEYALTGELGQEMVVFSMPPYIVICKKNFT